MKLRHLLAARKEWINLTNCLVLFHLYENGPSDSHSIAETCSFTPDSMSQVLYKLQSKGLTKKMDSQYRFGKWALTIEGDNLVEKIKS